MPRKSSSSQLTLLFATCRTYDEPAFIFITPGEKGWHYGHVSQGHPGTLRHIKSCRFEPTFASKFLVPNFSYWHRCARNSMHVLIGTFSYPPVALYRDWSHMLCTKEGHATVQGKGLPHATALEASLMPAQEGVVWREKSPATLTCWLHLPWVIFTQTPSSCP